MLEFAYYFIDIDIDIDIDARCDGTATVAAPMCPTFK